MSIYDSLNDSQKEAVFTTEGPLLILAGAGSGKTRALTHRIAYLIEEGIARPENIMAITFTNKAAGEMRDRVDNLAGQEAGKVWVATFHSSCVRILRRFISRLGYDNNFVIYDTDDQKTLMKEICKNLNINTKLYKERSLLSAISSAKNELIGPEKFAKIHGGDFSKQKIVEVYKEYQSQLYKNNALDFDDLIFKTVELLETNEDVRDFYQESLRYIMVDEYQDTNTAQFKLVSLLAGKYKNLCVVGDDDQSIYKFRGANIQNILSFETVFPEAKVIKLEQNYRSTKNILHAANEVIRHNEGRKDKTLWTQKEEGEKIILNQFETAYDEAASISKDIRELVENEGYKYSDIAVLYRTNAQSRILEEKLIRDLIPYKIINGINFYQRREIKDMLAYLRTVDNGRDDIAVKRIINVPKRGIGDVTISKVQDYAIRNEYDFFDALSKSREIPLAENTVCRVNSFVNFIHSLRDKLDTVTVRGLLEEIIDETGYLAELKLENTEEAQARIENVEELINKTAEFDERKADEALSEFLSDAMLMTNLDSLDTDTDYVPLMTIHNAKGLEYPKIFLTGMEDGLFPGFMSIGSDDPDELEEERRLCYVALTRAMRSLTITCARQRMVRGETQLNNISRFVTEIPEDMLDMKIKEGRMLGYKGRGSLASAPGRPSAKPFFLEKSYDPKKFEVKKADALSYGVGDTVKHVKFGEGKVMEVLDGGKDFEVTVDFQKAGTKKLFASFAKLQKI
ncbi:ATP-dependent helicase [Parasporobacterium paucivorans]|uniref:ATP-dependent DNA helicase PcrA n=1 Tax=Parasporobacterium paucivorans DSM 15970 TaxID=1122934 RepID=A0A1M6H9W9_9FIRM|nr:UvrD-helicase domain-containing protein [Parasporobacterium paucivorans]SHJ18884.1 DNA helicase-2 / ATP-dependent DNA helicase PcrA [Parasporobacterium paucivorans DSM 15970]